MVVLKNVKSIIPPKYVVVFTRAQAGIWVTPLASLELSTTFEKILVLEVTFSLIGYDANATTKSTSIFLPSFYYSLPCVFGLWCRSGMGLHFVIIERRHQNITQNIGRKEVLIRLWIAHGHQIFCWHQKVKAINKLKQCVSIFYLKCWLVNI
jgi:hypothetical protein